MKGYLNGATEKKELTSRPMSEVIDDWASRDPNPNLKGEIMSVNIYSDVAATALFNFNDVFIDSFQLAKTDSGWKIVNKYYRGDLMPPSLQDFTSRFPPICLCRFRGVVPLWDP